MLREPRVGHNVMSGDGTVITIGREKDRYPVNLLTHLSPGSSQYKLPNSKGQISVNQSRNMKADITSHANENNLTVNYKVLSNQLTVDS